MILIPSLELATGRLVLCGRGAGAASEVVEVPLLEAARRLRDAGADFFQVVDRDALAGGAPQRELLEVLPQAGLPSQALVGGHVDAALAAGIDRVVVGAAHCVADGGALAARLGVRLGAAVPIDDAADPATALGGLQQAGVRRVLLTPPEFGGVLSPEQVAPWLAARGDIEVTVESRIDGGAALRALAGLESAGLAGVVATSAFRAVLTAAGRG